MAVLASETASATAGREGKATSPDGKINLNLSPPGSNGPGTNPEQLFAAGYSACFGGAIGAAAGLAKIPLKPSRHQGDRDREPQQGRQRVLPGRDAERRAERRRPGAGRSARRQGAHHLPLLQGDARQHRGEAAGERQSAATGGVKKCRLPVCTVST